MSPAELEVRKREQNRILDMLEMEEETLERKVNEAETERRREALKNMKEASREGVKNFAQTREMQKKMGKALLRNMAAARKKDEKEKAEKEAEDLEKEKARRKKGPQKTVTFAEPEKEDEEKEKEGAMHEWGDVAQGRLTSTKRPTLLSRLNDNTLPMRMSVVERSPGQSNSPPEPPQIMADSDDESDPPLSEFGSSTDSPSEADEEVEEGFDMDYAQHQREIALEYHKKRETISRDVSLAMQSHTHEESEEQLSTSAFKKKTSLSHFKSERLASSYGASNLPSSLPPTSQCLDASVLPALDSETLRNAVRMGRLDSDDRLMGGAESDSEGDNEAVQEILQHLKKGEAYNAGPSKTKANSAKDSILPENLPPLLPRAKPSRFKAARSQAGRPATPSSQSDSSTPISIVPRSSPKLPPTGSSSLATGDMVSMIVESPSFPKPQAALPSRPIVMSSAVRESSQPQRREPARPQRPPTVKSVSSMVKETNPSGGQSVGERKPPKKVSRFLTERS
ncbi:uncharacterized protein BT62DRAFT_930149 [Guyanagaster necrorhizus]|uniref:DUF3835 domain-containing protein n=1 Tax=Guyanagaster necrorhizus TaxID=856835 RepID=A0A9P8AU36_9AGAR|nr:uncharacterized protein BT62DRAFT_930149 [Guyanagaster necrorhizus MCA 3950]KAG7448068.1 hypothetical protein BT62DRAFT_930149 [Guyanagaster necrorhizus MCA 3950]